MRLGDGLLGGKPQRKSTVFLTAHPGSVWPTCLVAVDVGRLAQGLWGLFTAVTPPAPLHTVCVCYASEHGPRLRRGFARSLEGGVST